MKMEYGCSKEHIAHYTCCRTNEPIIIDGNLDKPVWQKAEKSPRFADMVTGSLGYFNTQACGCFFLIMFMSCLINAQNPVIRIVTCGIRHESNTFSHYLIGALQVEGYVDGKETKLRAVNLLLNTIRNNQQPEILIFVWKYLLH